MPRDNNSKRRRRAYIGNLRPRQSLAGNLYNDLFIPHCLSVHDNINGITIPQSTKNNNKSNTYALVEFVDVDYAIQMLNGVQFDGRVLRVCKEKTNFGSSCGGGFGSSQWAGSDSFKSNSSGGKKRQSKPIPSAQKVESKTPITDDMDMNREEAINKQIETTISSEIQESNDKNTSALACTAAMTLLSSIDAFGLNEEEKKDANHNESDVFKVDSSNMTNQDFQSRCKMNLSDLMAEYGEQDVNWKKDQQQQPTKNEKNNDDFQSRCKLPLAELMAEYGEQDVEWKKDQHHNQSSTNNNNRSDNKNENNTGMLAHFNKASINLELVSFGYKYGGPSKKGGFSYANPLPSIDIRDLDRCPGNYGKFNGLSSYVKKTLLNPKQQQQHTNDGYTEDNDEHEQPSTNNSQSPMRLRANQIADEVIKILVEAIDEGGHGPISPLTMTVSIGSEYGRHRSVVLVEHLAVILRARLRRNDGRCFDTAGGEEGADNNKPIKNNGIIKQLVSVGTRHRDVEARHTDEEAFCGDLKREERKVEKIRKRQQQAEEEDSGWDNGSW